jgi:endonuclease VIII
VPEGDTVWNTAQALEKALAGQRLTGSDFRVPALATVDLADATVRQSTCRGKHLLLRLETADGRQLTLHSHLRMDGSWRTFPPGARWTGGPGHLIRVALHTPKAVAVGYHLHDLVLVPTAEEDRLVGHLGPDLLGPDWNPAEAVQRLAGHPDTAIAEALLDQTNPAGVVIGLDTSASAKVATTQGLWVPEEAMRRLHDQPDRTIGEALLDQRNVAGIGTIYRAETLFLRGVHPWTPVGEVADLDRLLGLARRLMRSNLGRRGGPVMTGDTRRGRQYWVYGRAGEPCRRCGTRVERGSMGPAVQERVVYWCPRCQPSTATGRNARI